MRLRNPRTRLALIAVWFGLIFALAPRASAETRTYLLAIGQNAPLPGHADTQHSLRFADDDAAAFYRFAADLSRRSFLLTVLDTDSQKRFPDLSLVAIPPTLSELRRAVATLKVQFESDRREGHDPVLLFFYSGHGNRASGAPPSLTMLDGPLTQEILYDEILATLPARYIHLLVDACHAEAVVRPRDGQAEIVELNDDDVRVYAARTTLARFPHVGAIVATASQAQSHEWDVFERGVFTHEVLSGLRGAADVNRDGKVEYSELSAFLAAANREVADPRARLQVVTHPPEINRRSPIVDTNEIKKSRRLTGQMARVGPFYVEDEWGNRLADVRAEANFRISLTLPPNGKLYLRTRDREAVLESGERIDVEAVKLQPLTSRSRGAIDSAMHRGLFAAEFGPVYYRGYVDHAEELIPVPLAIDEPTPTSPKLVVQRKSDPRTSLITGATALTIAGALTVTTGIFAGLALQARSDYNSTRIERSATEARERYDTDRGVAIGTGIVAAIASGIGTWLIVRAKKRIDRPHVE